MPLGTKAPKLWPADPVKVSEDRVVGQPGAAVPPADLGTEQRPHGGADVGDRQLDRHRGGVRQRGVQLSMKASSSAFSRPWSCRRGRCGRPCRGCRAGRGPWSGRCRPPSSGSPPLPSRAGRPARWPRRASAGPGRPAPRAPPPPATKKVSTASCSDVAVLWPQRRVLGGDADGAGVEVTDPHRRNAARDHDEGAVAKPYSSAPRGHR